MLEESAKEPNNNATQENTTEKQQQTAQEHPNKQPQTDRNVLQQLTHDKNLTAQFPDVIGQPRKTALNKRQNQTIYPQRKTKTKGRRKTLTLQACFQHRNRGSFLSVLVC